MSGDASGVGSLAREGLASLPLYTTDSARCAIDLSDNTNLWGAPPAALAALREVPSHGVSRYPTLYSEPLRDALLAHVGVPGDGDLDIVTGCGSDEVLDCAMRAFAGRNARIAFSAPTFSMIPVVARLNGLEPVTIPFKDDLDIDAERLVESGSDII